MLNQKSFNYPGEYFERLHATSLDDQDPLRELRKEFIIPSKDDLEGKNLAKLATNYGQMPEPCIYLCGNSLGLQPLRVTERVNSHLSAWAHKAVTGHFTKYEDSSLPPFLDVDDVAAEQMAPLVGALKSEVAVMETLTANLHLLMASFYTPTKEKYKIILEGKAFPSDHYAIESQIRHNKLQPADSMVLIEPDNPESSTLTTSHIISTIKKHASSTALILLPGIQYYTGQYFNIEYITAYAHSHNIIIGWDLAHAVGNVDLKLHEWGVDFAAWCNYKYVNSGPGAIAGLFVHSKHGSVDTSAIKSGKQGFRPRLCGWWGGEKSSRFEMGKDFIPIPGAAGFQVGNPSALALTALLASLEVFSLTTMSALRTKSMVLTKYLEDLLSQPSPTTEGSQSPHPYEIITPSDPAERGAQLSVRLRPGFLEGVMRLLAHAGVVVDERKPDVVRIAPAPLYNTFTEVWDFVYIFKNACRKVEEEMANTGWDATILQNRDKKSSP